MITSPNALLENGTLKNGLLPALKSYLFLKTNLDMMTPLFENVCSQALALFQPVVEDRELYKQCARPSPAGKPVTRWDSLCLTDDETAMKMYAWHKAQMAKHGHVVAGQHRCPFAVAENLLVQAENVLIREMEPFTQIMLNQLYVIENRKKYIDLIVGLLVKLSTEHNIPLNIIEEIQDKKRA